MRLACSGSMDPLLGWAPAIAVGFAASLHCFAMCGPLACAASLGSGRWRTIAAYQCGRLTSYALFGGLLGTLGEGASHAISVHLAPLAPWLLAATLLASAAGLGRVSAPIPGFMGTARRALAWSARFPALLRAGVMGSVTPLLPCGLLYGIFAASAAEGSFEGGALVLGAFGVGAVPALLVAQIGGQRLRGHNGRWALLAQRAVPAVAALVLVGRALLVGSSPTHSCH